jgi:two-component system KDP operon response regulator KdpE
VTRVFVVEDELPMSRTLDIGLRARGYEVDVAGTGEQALDLARPRHPDVVIIDLGLPGISGLQVVEALRQWSMVPLIVLSARGAEAFKVAALDAGADDYVTKPFGMDELLARIRAALRRHSGSGSDDSGRLVTYQQLLAEVWGPGYDSATHHLRVFMAQIRQKVEPDPAHPRYFQTEAGRGYRFDIVPPSPHAPPPPP